MLAYALGIPWTPRSTQVSVSIVVARPPLGSSRKTISQSEVSKNVLEQTASSMSILGSMRYMDIDINININNSSGPDNMPSQPPLPLPLWHPLGSIPVLMSGPSAPNGCLWYVL